VKSKKTATSAGKNLKKSLDLISYLPADSDEVSEGWFGFFRSIDPNFDKTVEKIVQNN